MELESLDPSVRYTIRKLMLALMVIFICADWIFFFVYLITGTLKGSVYYYIGCHVLAPIAVYIASTAIATYADKSDKLTERTKNYVLVFCIFAMAAGLSFFHAYFSPVWVAPAVVMMFATCFHEDKMQCHSVKAA